MEQYDIQAEKTSPATALQAPERGGLRAWVKAHWCGLVLVAWALALVWLYPIGQFWEDVARQSADGINH
jgi:hypothetical protein